MIVLSLLLHFVFSTLIGVFLSVISGNLTPAISLISLSLGTVLAIRTSRYLGRDYHPDFKKLGIFEIGIYGFLTFAALKHCVYLVFHNRESVKMLLVKNFGDLPLHVSFIHHMASGAAFPPANPVWAFDNLRYSLGMDFYNAMLSSIGFGDTAHFFLTGFILFIVSLAFLRWWGGLLVVGAFFLNGGFEGFTVFFSHLLADYQDPLAWKNFFLSVFLPQRGYLIALPLGVILLKGFRRIFLEEQTHSRGQLLVLGMLWGSMPLFHLHTFIVISLVCGLYAVTRPRYYLRFVTLFAGAFPLALVFVLYLTNLFGGAAKILNFKTGWMALEGNMPVGIENGFFQFWFLNAGPWFIFILISLCVSIWNFIQDIRKPGTAKSALNRSVVWLVPLSLFAFFNFVMLAPWAWDNIKVLVWVYLLLIVESADALRGLTGYLTERFPSRIFQVARNIVIAGSLSLLFFTGFISVLSSVAPGQRGYEMFNRKEIAAYKGALDGIDHNAVIAASNWANAPDNSFMAHPVSFLGYRLPLGYIGHIGSHGYEYSDELAILESLYRGDGDWLASARALNADYILYGPMERLKFANADPVWRTERTNLSRVPGYELYRVQP